MKKMVRKSDYIYNKVNRKVMIIAIVIFLLFTVTAFPLASNIHETKTGTAAMPDTLLFASVDDYYTLADGYGEAGINAYIWLRFTFDLAWPIAYGFVMVAVLSMLLKSKKRQWVRNLHLLPILGALFDITENCLAVIYMARYPLSTLWAVRILPFITAAKWAVLGLSFALMLVLLVTLGFGRLTRPKETHDVLR